MEIIQLVFLDQVCTHTAHNDPLDRWLVDLVDTINSVQITAEAQIMSEQESSRRSGQLEFVVAFCQVISWCTKSFPVIEILSSHLMQIIKVLLCTLELCDSPVECQNMHLELRILKASHLSPNAIVREICEMMLCWQNILHLMLAVFMLKVERISLVFVGLVFVYFPHVETTSEISKFISSDEQPKIWMRYTEKLVSVLLAEICRSIEFRRIDTTSAPMGFCFQQYCLINKKITFLILLKMIQIIAEDKRNKNSKLWQYHISIMLNSTIAVPILHVQVHKYPMFVLGGEMDRYFLYQLHTSLRLNVTFTHFALFFKDAHDCRVASVILKQKLKCTHSAEMSCFIEETKEDKRVRFVFCGVHSQFTNYFPRRDILFLMKTSSHSKFHIKVQFSIMDKQTRETLPLHSSSPTFLQWTLHFPKSKSTIHKLHIKVKKYRQILIQCTEVSPTWSVYDGPGLDSLPLNKCVNSTFQTMGFQLTVYIFVNQFANSSTVTFFRYSEQMQKDMRSVFLQAPADSQFIECTYGAGNASVTTFPAKSLENRKINTTVLVLKPSFSTDGDCLFSGFALFEKVDNTQKERYTVCKESLRHRSFYTDDSSALLVVTNIGAQTVAILVWHSPFLTQVVKEW